MDLQVGCALSAEEIVALLAEARKRTLLLTEALSEEDLRVQHDPLMSPILWDLGHIGHFEEVWLIENTGNGDADFEDLRGMYNPFDVPRAERDGMPLPTFRQCTEYLEGIRRNVIDRIDTLELTDDSSLLRDGFVFRMVLQHEYQHNETILQTLQLKRGERYPALRRGPPRSGARGAPEPGTMVLFPGGVVEQGTHDRSVAYDNERPSHTVELSPFWIDAHPVTNGEYRSFLEDGAYEDRTLWSPAGWAWKEEAELKAPRYWGREGEEWTERFMDVVEPLDSAKPVCHICYWEADAYARWAGKRIPTESEWEAAASWDPATGAKRWYPWGAAPPTSDHANLDALSFGTTAVGSYPAGVSPLGCWDMIGNVWEWTSTDFHAYPGYQTFPYPEYSEVFFGDQFKVLRGGAWATRFGAIRSTFRNWDYPIRRQIFSGVRCARDE